MAPEYWHDDDLKLHQRLAERKCARDLAEKEIDHARSLRLDMEGPIKAAQDEIQRRSKEIDHVLRLIERVNAGFPYLETTGFEAAVEACGEIVNHTELADVSIHIAGNDKAVIRLPVEVQKRYGQAVATDLFERFEVCETFEPPEAADHEPPVTHYLFGMIRFEDDTDAKFLVAQW